VTRNQFKELVGIAIGEASMCWSEPPTGIFDSGRASDIVDRIVNEFPLTYEEVESLENAKKLGW
jgi:hypothetical protein